MGRGGKQASSLQTLSLHLWNAARVWGAARPDGVQCSSLQPKPSTTRAVQKDRQFPRSWETSSIPNNHYSEMPSSNLTGIQLPWGTALPREAAPPKRLATLGYTAWVCKGCIYT